MNIGKWDILKSLKITIAAVIAICLANVLGLQYAVTAGIVTVLSIQNTKRETLITARNRGVAFICALLLGGACFYIMGFHVGAFGVYLLLFSLVCYRFSWLEAIAMDSVLISHFLSEQSLGMGILWNEILLFIIGTGMGILANLHLHKRENQFNELAGEVDDQMKQILHRMSQWLPKENKEEYHSNCFISLEQAIEDAKSCAMRNYNNAVFTTDTEEIDYIHMREQQSVILKEIYENIKGIAYLPEQAHAVSNLFGEIEVNYDRGNTTEELMKQLQQLLDEMKTQPLPKNREEFEARAILFYILVELQKLLTLKWEFMKKKIGKCDKLLD